MRPAFPVLVVCLSGCPFIFGPPDLSKVPDGGTVDSGAVSDPPAATVQLVPEIGGVLLEVTIRDPDGLLSGGVFNVEGSGLDGVLQLPDERLDGGTYTALLDFDEPACDGVEVALQTWAEAGEVSTERVRSELRVFGYRESDWGESSIDGFRSPALWCGEALSGFDEDVIRFELKGEDSLREVILDWERSQESDFVLDVACIDPKQDFGSDEDGRPRIVEVDSTCGQVDVDVRVASPGTDYWVLFR